MFPVLPLFSEHQRYEPATKQAPATVLLPLRRADIPETLIQDEIFLSFCPSEGYSWHDLIAPQSFLEGMTSPKPHILVPHLFHFYLLH